MERCLELIGHGQLSMTGAKKPKKAQSFLV